MASKEELADRPDTVRVSSVKKVKVKKVKKVKKGQSLDKCETGHSLTNEQTNKRTEEQA